MSQLNVVEIKAFLPAKDYQLSKQFYCDFGFTKASDHGGVAYFYFDQCSFLLQDFYHPALAENLMMHLLVEDVKSWFVQLEKAELAKNYNVQISDIVEQPWGMVDFTVKDPSGVLWRIAQNL